MKLPHKISILVILFISLTSLVFYEGDNGYFVYLHGKKQFVIVEGEGEPTVVFLTGKGRTQTDFKKVYTKIKNTAQIFSYDRAGLGQSEAFKNDRTVDTMAFELHELLVKEKIKPPYILVGHSLGGYIMRCFVNMYPSTVAGMVFVLLKVHKRNIYLFILYMIYISCYCWTYICMIYNVCIGHIVVY